MRGRMCCGVLRDKLVIRVSPEEYKDVLNDRNTAPTDQSCFEWATTALRWLRVRRALGPEAACDSPLA